jgi:hypothetical protein
MIAIINTLNSPIEAHMKSFVFNVSNPNDVFDYSVSHKL